MKSSLHIRKRLTTGPFDNGKAIVYLDGQPVGRLSRNWKWLEARIDNYPHIPGGGRTLDTALHSIAVTLNVYGLPEAIA